MKKKNLNVSETNNNRTVNKLLATIKHKCTGNFMLIILCSDLWLPWWTDVGYKWHSAVVRADWW